MYPNSSLAAGKFASFAPFAPLVRLIPLALLAAFPAVSARAADTGDETIVVTATRFSEADPGLAGNISVITRQDIQNSPAQNLPEVLSTRAGINVSQLGGLMGRDATVDLRGFSTTATGNTLILLDGQRVNPVDMGSIIWSAIPLESVERIEIIRGSGTVLYGDGATGGVINVITHKSGKPVASIAATLGSHGLKGGDIHLSNGNDKVYYNLFVNHADSNGYRNNSQQDQLTTSGRVGLLLDRGEIFTDFAVYKESAGQPGSIFSAAFHNDPRSTRTPLNKEERDGYRVRPGITYRLNDRLTLETEVAFEHQKLDAEYHSAFGDSASHRVRETASFTPRLRWQHSLASLPSETVFGFDYYDGEVSSDNIGYASQGASQESSALYVQNITRLTQNLSLTLGGRTQRMEQEAHQDAYAPFFSPAMEGDKIRTMHAHDLGVSYTAEAWRIYGKTGSTFRFANLDELFGLDAFFNPVFAGDLKPQHGRTHEIGGNITLGQVRLKGSLYRLDLKDEIGYDGALGANVNFSPTRRKGAELEADWKITNAVQLKGSYAFTDARFRDGAYSGKEVPLVPRHQASAQLSWNTGRTGTYSAAVRHVGERRYGTDFNNSHGRLSGFTTLDLQSVWDLKPWKITARVLNALDKKYAMNAGYSTTYNDHYYYPADGRSFVITGRYDF